MDQGEAAFYFFSEELNFKIPISQLFYGIGSRCTFLHLESSLVPNIHLARSVIALWNRPLKAEVLYGMVFCSNRQTLVLRIQGWAFWHSPTFQDTLHFQSQVIVQPSRLMPLDHKAEQVFPVHIPFGFGSGIEFSILFVLLQSQNQEAFVLFFFRSRLALSLAIKSSACVGVVSTFSTFDFLPEALLLIIFISCLL